MRTKQVIVYVKYLIMQENSLFRFILKKNGPCHGNLLHRSRKMGVKWSLLTRMNCNCNRYAIIFCIMK